MVLSAPQTCTHLCNPGPCSPKHLRLDYFAFTLTVYTRAVRKRRGANISETLNEVHSFVVWGPTGASKFTPVASNRRFYGRRLYLSRARTTQGLQIDTWQRWAHVGFWARGDGYVQAGGGGGREKGTGGRRMLIGDMREELMGGSPRRQYPALIQGASTSGGLCNFRIKFPGISHARFRCASDLKPGASSRALFLSAGGAT